MSHHTKDTAHYQLCKFIQSKKHYDFDLLPSDLTILFIIARYLDMPKGECFGFQSTLARECLMSERTFRDRCNHLVDKKLLFRYEKTKSYHYELGFEITGIAQN
jgi:hypothetical protein